MTIQQGTKALMKELSAIYDEREAAAITDWVFEYLTGWRKLDRVMHKDVELAKEKQHRLGNITTELIAHKPVQYVLNEAWFYGMKLYVDENVLIPRPETEELVAWAIDEVDSTQVTVNGGKIQVLDIGTGSGCIPIALKKSRPAWEVYGCDISEGALTVANRNSAEQKTDIKLKHLNFLDDSERASLPTFDLIISNPPYIAVAEKSSIDKHVIEFEPHQALFVPDEDALVFYRSIADFGKSHLRSSGLMMMEMHYAQAKALKQLFNDSGYNAEIRRDMHGNDRMIKAWR
jgi:release factor glutamine methyltransferase